MMKNYETGKIYALKSNKTEDIYYGSTMQSLADRFMGHNRDYKCFKKGKGHYRASYELLKYDDCYIELYEFFPCKTRKELETREGEIISNNTCVNRYVAGRTKKKHYEDNREEILERGKQIVECECGSKITKYHLSRHRSSNKHQKYLSTKIIS